MAEQHSCQALAIHCIDFRIQRFLNNYLDERFSDGYDRIAAPGGAKYLVEGGQHVAFELEKCSVSYSLHHPRTIVLVQHEDCGAYGGNKEFRGKQKEMAFHRQEIQKAARVLQEQFPNCAVKGYFIDLSGNLTPVL